MIENDLLKTQVREKKSFPATFELFDFNQISVHQSLVHCLWQLCACVLWGNCI